MKAIVVYFNSTVLVYVAQAPSSTPGTSKKLELQNKTPRSLPPHLDFLSVEGKTLIEKLFKDSKY